MNEYRPHMISKESDTGVGCFSLALEYPSCPICLPKAQKADIKADIQLGQINYQACRITKNVSHFTHMDDIRLGVCVYVCTYFVWQ